MYGEKCSSRIDLVSQMPQQKKNSLSVDTMKSRKKNLVFLKCIRETLGTHSMDFRGNSTPRVFGKVAEATIIVNFLSKIFCDLSAAFTPAEIARYFYKWYAVPKTANKQFN